MTSSQREGLVAVIVAVVFIVVLLKMSADSDACTKRGGEYVRGTVWYVCVGD